MITTTALPAVLTALYDRHVSLTAANRVHLIAAPAGVTEPHVVLPSDTENPNVLLADRDGTPNEVTARVNYWHTDYATALALYQSFLSSVAATPLVVTGFSVLDTDASTLRLSEPDGSKTGVSVLYRFTLDPST